MNDRFMFRAWDIEEQKYREVIALGQDRSFLLNIGHVRNDTQIFEQCTGIKDKDDTPDYEDNLYFEEKKMTDLTEQWKKGELPKGEEYWVILTDEWYLQNPVKPVRAFYSCDCEFEGYLDDDIQQVLAPVPTFDEWKAKLRALDAAHKTIKMEDETINRLVCSGKQLNYENAKLKELLKECELWFTGIVGNMNDKNVGEHNRSLPIGNFEHIFKEFSQKIDEVLK